MNFYHGTSDILGIEDTLLPPIYTNILREDWRKKNQDVVFLTISRLSAERYARKACTKFGGSPIIFKAVPIGDCFNIYTNEYIAEMAKIIG